MLRIASSLLAGAALIEKPRHRRVVRGKHGDLWTLGLTPTNLGNGDLLASGHGGDPTTRPDTFELAARPRVAGRHASQMTKAGTKTASSNQIGIETTCRHLIWPAGRFVIKGWPEDTVH